MISILVHRSRLICRQCKTAYMSTAKRCRLQHCTQMAYYSGSVFGGTVEWVDGIKLIRLVKYGNQRLFRSTVSNGVSPLVG